MPTTTPTYTPSPASRLCAAINILLQSTLSIPFLLDDAFHSLLIVLFHGAKAYLHMANASVTCVPRQDPEDFQLAARSGLSVHLTGST